MPRRRPHAASMAVRCSWRAPTGRARTLRAKSRRAVRPAERRAPSGVFGSPRRPKEQAFVSRSCPLLDQGDPAFRISAREMAADAGGVGQDAVAQVAARRYPSAADRASEHCEDLMKPRQPLLGAGELIVEFEIVRFR